MDLATDGKRIDLVEPWRIFIANDQVGFVAAHGTATHKQLVVDSGGQGFGQQHHALEIVDVVVH